MVLSSQGGHGAGGEGMPGSQGLGLFPVGLPRPHPHPHWELRGGWGRGVVVAGQGPEIPGSTLPRVASPDVHLVGAEAEVGVQDEAGGQVVILTQFSSGYSVGPHGALRTMLPLVAAAGGGESEAGGAALGSHVCACPLPLVSPVSLGQALWPPHL